MKDKILISIGLIGGLIAKMLGGWDTGLATLIIFMSIDYVSGMAVAGVFHASQKTDKGTLESRAGFKGLCKKCMVLLFVLIGHRLDLVMGSNYIRDAVVIGFIANEVISITENAGLMGVPLPSVIDRALEVLVSEKGEDNGQRG